MTTDEERAERMARFRPDLARAVGALSDEEIATINRVMREVAAEKREPTSSLIPLAIILFASAATSVAIAAWLVGVVL